MKTEILLRNENLWQRIQGFSLDAQNASFPFSKKLAKEEKQWLAVACPYLDPVYLDFLEGYRYDPSEVEIIQTGIS